MRSRIAKRLPPDADKLVGLSLALFASGSRTEDRFWEAKLDVLLAKIIRNANQTTLDAALDHLQQNHPDAYGALADMAETHSESFVLEHEGVPYEALLIAAPVLAWTRYMIPSGPLKTDAADALRAHLQAHVLAANTRVAMVPFLYSIDQLPRHHVETWRIAQQLAQAAMAGSNVKLNFGELPETSPILADPRFLLAVVAAPVGEPAFRWQEEENGSRIERGQCLEQWATQGGANLSLVLPGCEFECLLPDAYYSACRDADESVRPHTVRTAVRYLFDTIGTAPQELRAVVAGFGERRIDEYRVGFTRKGSNDVIYGVVWPLYGRENGEPGIDEEPQETAASDDPLEEIVALLKETGVTDVRRHAGRFEPEYCDDCGVPLYADPLGEIVHAEMPEDAEPAQPHFH
ncbi:hypothetical protein OI25_396 [Paraburkholderia fungorum]|jgi:hypothetical protein|uniref:DUF2863 family protein n=2 Tax=Paraburkholderia fungorum TaxID=134537 RepID=A0AAP5QBS6_9BURK|nr:DUF2863 family protein [Paraburkholderia fungorum]KFX61582.1 hypothetical protein KBK24_0131240 [Burkholderia sp. K24]AJZ57695.1 hypothetical protein OI25_396 [Paraburkholderia fungorum]MBU7437760.1 DUF2863 family protein [Paraburkholderia fungorum]MDT8840678.1 DUF2863 family protein [Paraburkholderia fungorum]QLD47914.1 DUF2863 domain-containing protein [Paraburkholderia fungorum]